VRKTFQGYLEVGRRPAFRRFWLGMMISRAGDAFTTVTLAWVVLDIAGPVQLGVVLMCFGLPRIVSGPVAGRLLERFRPRNLAILFRFPAVLVPSFCGFGMLFLDGVATVPPTAG
jgi:MFS family permease